MLGVLLESRARRQRRAGGAAMSVAAHLAIVGALTATAAHVSRPAVDHPAAIMLRFPPPPPPPLLARVASGPSAPPIIGVAPTVNLMHFPLLTHIPTTIPPVIQVNARAFDSISIGGPVRGGRGVPNGIPGADDAGSSDNTWSGNEVLMHLLTTVRPSYPEMLRSAGIDGRVVVQFTVDTVGRVDMASVRILSSTHDQFTRSVLDALRRFRFQPAQVAGHRVSALAEMPFDFQIAR